MGERAHCVRLVVNDWWLRHCWKSMNDQRWAVVWGNRQLGDGAMTNTWLLGLGTTWRDEEAGVGRAECTISYFDKGGAGLLSEMPGLLCRRPYWTSIKSPPTNCACTSTTHHHTTTSM